MTPPTITDSQTIPQPVCSACGTQCAWSYLRGLVCWCSRCRDWVRPKPEATER